MTAFTSRRFVAPLRELRVIAMNTRTASMSNWLDCGSKVEDNRLVSVSISLCVLGKLICFQAFHDAFVPCIGGLSRLTDTIKAARSYECFNLAAACKSVTIYISKDRAYLLSTPLQNLKGQDSLPRCSRSSESRSYHFSGTHRVYSATPYELVGPQKVIHTINFNNPG